MITYYPDYLYSVDLTTIDNTKLVNHCLEVEQQLINIHDYVDPGVYGNLASAHNFKYGLLTYPTRELNQLYHDIVKTVSPFLNQETDYVIKSWLNVYRVGEKVDWHAHWAAPKKVWHGFYCAQVGESCTYYRIPGVDDVITVPSKEGRLVFGKSDGDQHCSSEWSDSTRPRLTLAFDIIPVDSIGNKLFGNHFIPFKPITK